MNLDKAIDTLLHNKDSFCASLYDDLRKAILLGYQALKRIQSVRISQPQSSIHLLPGETKK